MRGNVTWTDKLHHPNEDLKVLDQKNIPSQVYTQTRKKIGTVFLSYKRDVVSKSFPVLLMLVREPLELSSHESCRAKPSYQQGA